MARGTRTASAALDLAAELGHIRGVVEGIAAKQDDMRGDFAEHMRIEEGRLGEQDKRLRRVEVKVHTSWIVGGGALAIAGAYIAHLLGWKE